MSETKHTPGPWTLKYVAHSKRGAVRIVDKATHGRICEVQDARQDMEGAPNARLIAAAPELADALRECVCILGSILDGTSMPHDNDVHAVLSARAALEKAGVMP